MEKQEGDRRIILWKVFRKLQGCDMDGTKAHS
jgi:hypothetical protein